jgi:hypothetical protein
MPYYGRFDGQEVDGKVYALGDPIDEDVDAAVIDVLIGLGRLTTTRPTVDGAPTIPTETKAVEDMSRVELEAAAMDAMRSRLGEAPDEDLRRVVTQHREAVGADADEGEEPDATTLADKPLDEMSAKELDAVAGAEGVDVSKARTKSDRVAAIQEARLAKSNA